MTMASFLRRFSVDADVSPKTSFSSPRSRGEKPRRSRLAAGFESARRRFSLQHSNDVCQHLQTIALKAGKAENGSLPDLLEVRGPGQTVVHDENNDDTFRRQPLDGVPQRRECPWSPEETRPSSPINTGKIPRKPRSVCSFIV